MDCWIWGLHFSLTFCSVCRGVEVELWNNCPLICQQWLMHFCCCACFVLRWSTVFFSAFIYFMWTLLVELEWGAFMFPSSVFDLFFLFKVFVFGDNWPGSIAWWFSLAVNSVNSIDSARPQPPALYPFALSTVTWPPCHPASLHSRKCFVCVKY